MVVELTPHHDTRQEVQEAGLPMKIKIRFVTVRLKTGELEVLATNLLDETLYPTDCFEELYHYRWVIETYYSLLKGRLDLGHFTGLTSKAIRQDVYSTVFVSNLESILIDPANQLLEEKSRSFKNRQQVNHADSFHTITPRGKSPWQVDFFSLSWARGPTIRQHIPGARKVWETTSPEAASAATSVITLTATA